MKFETECQLRDELERVWEMLETERRGAAAPVAYVQFAENGAVRMWSRSMKDMPEDAMAVYTRPGTLTEVTDEMVDKALFAYQDAQAQVGSPFQSAWIRAALESVLLPQCDTTDCAI